MGEAVVPLISEDIAFLKALWEQEPGQVSAEHTRMVDWQSAGPR